GYRNGASCRREGRGRVVSDAAVRFRQLLEHQSDGGARKFSRAATEQALGGCVSFQHRARTGGRENGDGCILDDGAVQRLGAALLSFSLGASTNRAFSM